jgi:hypothetical protein
MRTEFQHAIIAASQQEARHMVATIKRAVAAEIRAADPSVSVSFTDYFNNTLVPDMVLRWPRENRERLLYVRSNPNDEWLLNGLRHVSMHKPLIFTLEDLPSGDTIVPMANRRELAERAHETGTWVTDPSGVAVVSEVRGQKPYLGLLSQALVRGGRGVSGGSEVERLAERTDAGFTASRQFSAPGTRQAVQALEDSLDAEQSARLTRVLRAVWEGHGGASSKFPATSSVGSLTDDDLTYLLSAMDQATDRAPVDFWRRIGRTITTAQLARVRVEDPSPSLQALVATSLDSLQVRGVRVVDEPFRLGESDEVPRWLVDKGCLGLRGLNWTAYVAARRIEELPPADDAAVPDLAVLRRRASRGQAPISQVQFGRDDRAITYESKDGTDVLSDESLQEAVADLGATAIEKAVATLDRDRSVGIDFAQKTAIGPTNAIFPMGAILRSVLPLIFALDDDEIGMVLQSLTPQPSQDDLFDART